MIVKRRDGAVLRQLRILFNIGTIGEMTDGQLLERFAIDPDEVAELAFSALVERHGALVWRVCLAILRDEHDAEDAFQATFLVLVRRARSLWVQDSLGPWLHQVACRTASCLRASVIRRRRHERRRAERDSTQSVEIATPRDSDRDTALHEEINRLPEKYRAPIVLCDLEGRSHREAARALGWPIGTVKSRQSQARGLLRDRLSRRGIGLSAVGAVVESLRQSAAAAVAKELSRSTVNASMQQAGRLVAGITISSQVLTLTQGVLQIMLWIRLRFLTVAAVGFGIASGGASVYVCGSQEPNPKEGQAVSKRSEIDSSRSGPSKNGAGRSAIDSPRQRLRAQQLAARKAKANYEIARLTRELAEIAIEEYDEFTFPRDLVVVEGEITLAESNLRRTKDRLDWARRMFDKGYVSQAQKASEEIAHKKAVFTLEQAQSKRKVLVDYTRGKTIKELESEVEKARSDELARKQDWEREQAKVAELEPKLLPDRP
ncbi:MAG: sigma-70 family RNA polymerase sigma factor [Isosphaeraceae bacterium]